MTRWRELASRPLTRGPEDARRLLAFIAGLFVVLGAVAIALNPSSGGDDNKPRTTAAAPATPPAAAAPAAPIQGIDGQDVSGVPSPELETAARTFFGTYLRRLYGKGGSVRSAAPRLTRTLQRQDVLPGMKALDPIVTDVRTAKATSTSATVTVTVDDGRSDGTTQPVSARFRVVDGKWVAVGMEGLT